MKKEFIDTIINKMLPHLDNFQLIKLKQVLEETLSNCDVNFKNDGFDISENNEIVDKFISSKKIEGCSEKTLKYYKSTITIMLETVGKNIQQIQTEDIRKYLSDHQKKTESSRVTIDNIRRILSSFFSWMEDEDYIIKSPMRRIHKVKSATFVKKIISDEDMERLRDACGNMRDLAIIDMLASTGMRVGEMVLLNR